MPDKVVSRFSRMRRRRACCAKHSWLLSDRDGTTADAVLSCVAQVSLRALMVCNSARVVLREDNPDRISSRADAGLHWRGCVRLSKAVPVSFPADAALATWTTACWVFTLAAASALLERTGSGMLSRETSRDGDMETDGDEGGVLGDMDATS